MSRLAEQQKKRMTTNIFFGILILLGLVVFIFTFGIKLLLNTSVFVARLSDKSINQPLKKNGNLIFDVDIDNIPVATNSAKIIVGGSVVNLSQVEFYINGDLVKEVPLLESDNFIEEIGDLKSGENEVFVIAKEKDENLEKKSKSFTVLFKNEKPKLDIKEPQDNLKTNIQEINVIGQTDKEIYIRVNDYPVVVDAQGSFQTFIKLKEGENKITVTAEDIAGNIEEKVLTITYERD